MIFKYRIADVTFGVDLKYKSTYMVLKDFLIPDDSAVDFVIKITDDDLCREKEISAQELSHNAYESTALYRKFIYKLIKDYDAFFFHCSAIAVDNKAILFSAKSGTGKSTHRKLWQSVYGDKVSVINDDKPIIRKVDGIYYAYDTPWRGKEGLGGEATKVPVSALCFLSRSEASSISLSDGKYVATRLLKQTLIPEQPQLVANLLELLDGFTDQLKIYDLRVNMDKEAAITAYRGILSTYTNVQ